MSGQLVERLRLTLETIPKVVTVANGAKSRSLSKVRDIPVLFEDLETQLYFLVLKNAPFDLLIGRPTLKGLG